MQRLSARGRALAYETAAVDGIAPHLRAFQSLTGRALRVTGRNRWSAPYLLAVHDSPEAFGLIRIVPTPAQTAAALVLMAPAPEGEALQSAWAELTDGLISLAGTHDARFVCAETPIDGLEANALARAGFVPLLQQDVFKLARVSLLSKNGGGTAILGLRRQERNDNLHVKLLATRAVPRSVTNPTGGTDASRLLHTSDAAYIWMKQQTPVAHISMRTGRRGYALRMLALADDDMVRENMQHALQTVVAQVCTRANAPVYCTLGAYQSWLSPYLENSGFVHLSSNMVMLRHIAQLVRKPVWSDQALALQGNRSGRGFAETEAAGQLPRRISITNNARNSNNR